jgi:hypothetical protein
MSKSKKVSDIALKAKQKADRKLEGEAYKEYKKVAKELDKATKRFGKENPGKTKPTKELQKKYDDMFMARDRYETKKIDREVKEMAKPSEVKLYKSKTLKTKRAEAKAKEKKALRKKDPAFKKAKRDLVKMGVAATGITGAAAGVGKLVEDALTKKPVKKAGGGIAKGARAGKKVAEAIEKRARKNKQSESPPSARRDMAKKDVFTGKKYLSGGPKNMQRMTAEYKAFLNKQAKKEAKKDKSIAGGVGLGVGTTTVVGGSLYAGAKKEKERLKKEEERIKKFREKNSKPKGKAPVKKARGGMVTKWENKWG